MDICKYRNLYNNEIKNLLNSKKICNAASINSDAINVTPLLFTYDYRNEEFTFYLLNINNDSNLTTLKDNDSISIFLEDYVLGFYIDAYKNITAQGHVEYITEEKEKAAILTSFKKKYALSSICTNEKDFKFMKVKIDNIIGRQY